VVPVPTHASNWLVSDERLSRYIQTCRSGSLRRARGRSPRDENPRSGAVAAGGVVTLNPVRRAPGGYEKPLAPNSQKLGRLCCCRQDLAAESESTTKACTNLWTVGTESRPRRKYRISAADSEDRHPQARHASVIRRKSRRKKGISIPVIWWGPCHLGQSFQRVRNLEHPRWSGLRAPTSPLPTQKTSILRGLRVILLMESRQTTGAAPAAPDSLNRPNALQGEATIWWQLPPSAWRCRAHRRGNRPRNRRATSTAAPGQSLRVAPAPMRPPAPWWSRRAAC
jgi:hypothetical protein